MKNLLFFKARVFLKSVVVYSAQNTPKMAFCLAHSEIKEVYETYVDYTETARKVDRELLFAGFKRRGIVVVIAAAAIFTLCSLFRVIFSFNDEAAIDESVILQVAIPALFGTPILAIIVYAFFENRRREKKKKKLFYRSSQEIGLTFRNFITSGNQRTESSCL